MIDLINKVDSLKQGYIRARLICIVSFILNTLVACSSGNVTSDSSQVQPPPNINNFKNPLLISGADPWVYKTDTEYFVTFTTGDNISLIRTKKMSDLKNGVKKIVWTPPSSGFNSKEIWAPELHRIKGVWYIYYAASDGDNKNHKMWILKNTSEDPFDGTWIDMGELKLPDNKWAIDGTYIELNHQAYFAWSGWEGEENLSQNIYIAKMETPLKVSSERICLLKPTASWETNTTHPIVTEAPQFLIRNSKLFLFYSAGGCWTDGYSLGMMWMDISKNPLELSSWQLSENNPLFVSNPKGNAFGPGHHSFFTSLDGKEDWILYHANPESGQGCGEKRSMRMQPFLWDAKGEPFLGLPKPLTEELKIPGGE